MQANCLRQHLFLIFKLSDDTVPNFNCTVHRAGVVVTLSSRNQTEQVEEAAEKILVYGIDVMIMNKQNTVSQQHVWKMECLQQVCFISH